MSELAYNMQGDRFEPPPLATYWRVRRLKPGGRGTPDVMFGADGAPLMIAIDTDLAEFRKLVNHEPGRYRLDPVDDNHKASEDGCPAYLQIAAEAEAPRNAPAPCVTDASANLMEMLVRANTQMVTGIADRFASVMESAAVLLRAADGAGLPLGRHPRAASDRHLKTGR